MLLSRRIHLENKDYNHLANCDTLEDIKLNLQETDYGQFLRDFQELDKATIARQAYDKLAKEWQFVHANAADPLRTFMDFVTYEFMIQNVMLIIKAVHKKHGSGAVDMDELLAGCHPLGQMDSEALKSIQAFEPTPEGYAELYQTVLIDTPIGIYFQKYLADQILGKMDPSEVQQVFTEKDIVLVEEGLINLWLEDFYAFCMKIGGDTAEVMGHILKERADARAINITLNSFKNNLNDANQRQSDRKDLYPSIGYLYPDGILRLEHVSDEDGLQSVFTEGGVVKYSVYNQIWQEYKNDVDGMVDIINLFYVREVEQNELAFDQQNQYGIFYSYVKLKEQEIRNILWIIDCIVQRQKKEIRKMFVPVLSPTSPWRVAALARK